SWPNDAEALAGLGEALLHLGKPDEAMALLHRAIAIEPDNALFHNSLGRALVSGDPEAAIEHFRRATELRPALVEAWTNLGSVFTKEGVPRQALPIQQHALTIDPRSA